MPGLSVEDTVDVGIGGVVGDKVEGGASDDPGDAVGVVVGTVNGVDAESVVGGKVEDGVSDGVGEATGPVLRLLIGDGVGVAFVKVVGVDVRDTTSGDVSDDVGAIVAL